MKRLATLAVYITILTTAATVSAYAASCGEGKDKDGDSARSISEAGFVLADASDQKDDSERGVSFEFPVRA